MSEYVAHLEKELCKARQQMDAGEMSCEEFHAINMELNAAIATEDLCRMQVLTRAAKAKAKAMELQRRAAWFFAEERALKRDAEKI